MKVVADVEGGCFQWPAEMAVLSYLGALTCKNSGRLMGSIHLKFQKLGVANIHDFLPDNIQVQHHSMFET